MFKTKINIIALLTILAAVISSCTGSSADKHEEEEGHNHNEATEGMAVLSQAQRDAINLKVGSVSMRNMSAIIKANGVLKVSPTDKAEITSFMGGNVKSIKVFQGDKVRKSQVLATLEHPDFIKLQQEFIQASQNYLFSKKEYERQKELFENNAGSGKAFQKTESEYRSNKAQYEGLKIRLKMLNLDCQAIEKGNLATEVKIISPIAGYVNQIDISLGSFVNSETKMFTISNNNNIHADLLVYEKEISALSVGQKARLQVANMPDVELDAKIFSIAKEYEKDAKAVIVHAHIKNAPDKLIAGSYVSGDIFTQNTNIQSVPETAIVQDGGKKYIFVFDEKGSIAANHEHEEDADEHAHEADNHDHDADDHAHEKDKHDHDADDHDHEADNHDHDTDDHSHEAGNHDNDNNDHAHDADKHDHDADDHAHDAHNSYESFKNQKVAFRMVEVVTGVEDNGYVAITFVENMPKDAKIVLDGAFYLLSDLKKSEAAHVH